MPIRKDGKLKAKWASIAICVNHGGLRLFVSHGQLLIVDPCCMEQKGIDYDACVAGHGVPAPP